MKKDHFKWKHFSSPLDGSTMLELDAQIEFLRAGLWNHIPPLAYVKSIGLQKFNDKYVIDFMFEIRSSDSI